MQRRAPARSRDAARAFTSTMPRDAANGVTRYDVDVEARRAMR